MKAPLEIVKGLHPGVILGRELKSRSITHRHFATMVDEFPQTLGAIISGRRRMNTALSLKIEEALGIEEGYFMTLQIFHDIKDEREKMIQHPDLTQLRPALFWESDITKINWQRCRSEVIRRVMKLGNDRERAEITRFYSAAEVDRVMTQSTNQQ